MRRLTLLALVVLAAAAMLILAAPASAHQPCAETFDRPGASDYGRDHIAAHGPHGLGVDGHNPGTHRGYSVCNPSGQ